MNILQLKRKLTTGAPTLAQLAIGEICLNVPDSTIYWKKDASTIVGPIGVNSSNGDMQKSTYDTNNNGRPDFADNALQLGGVAAASYATQTFVNNAISALVNGAPGALDALNELAAAIGNDANFAATMATALSAKLDGNSTIDCGTF